MAFFSHAIFNSDIFGAIIAAHWQEESSLQGVTKMAVSLQGRYSNGTKKRP